VNIPQLLQRLQTDNTSGASTLLEHATEILDTFASQHALDEREAFRAALEAVVHALLAAQPAMAPLLNLVNQALHACPDTLAPALACQQLRQMLRRFRHAACLSMAALCRQTLVILPPQATILTYSNSATVIAALHYAHERGRVRRIMLSESRPAYDGRPQALALLAHRMTVEYSVDMALFDRLPEAQVVLVGADAVFPHGLVNKVGTRPLAQIARQAGIPMFSLCASGKFLPAAATPLLQFTDHPDQEVWPDAPPGISIRNRYFETTPLPLFTGIISEHGVYAPAALRTHLQQYVLSPALFQLVSRRPTGDEHRAFTTHRPPLEDFQER
jgi:translation initiation factor 2B subunit (eIF-2B alpha/beta/delta family)